MNTEQLRRIKSDKGFIAALDQSGGSTPKALLQYGIAENRYGNEKEMFDLVHEMRSRIMTSPAFTGQHILGVILFENTMLRSVDGLPTAKYLWERKSIVPFLKIDQGLAEKNDGVQLMKDMPNLDALLKSAVAHGIFGTKMRSVIHDANPDGIRRVVEQQFAVADTVTKAGLVPIIEPEVDIHSPEKKEAERILKDELRKSLSVLPEGVVVMLKLSIPDEDNLYSDLMKNPHVARIVALSGGYSREEADAKLARNKGMIASFSRALVEGLYDDMSEHEFNRVLAKSIGEIYDASVAG